MSPHGRRKSVDSSDSTSSSSDSDGSHKYGKIKKNEKGKKDKKDKKARLEGRAVEPPFGGHGSGMQMPLMPDLSFPGHRVMPAMPAAFQGATPAHQSSTPASGYRIPLHASSPFPEAHLAGVPPCHDVDGSPVYFGSALFDKSVHPCKVAPRLPCPCSVAYGGTEVSHNGRFDLLPFDPSTMELVRTSDGHIPQGRRPVEGGYEEGGNALYHGIAVRIKDGKEVRVPGKVGTHLYVLSPLRPTIVAHDHSSGGCNFSFAGGEHVVTKDYEILYVPSPSPSHSAHLHCSCWK